MRAVLYLFSIYLLYLFNNKKRKLIIYNKIFIPIQHFFFKEIDNI